MNPAIGQMLKRYTIREASEYEYALREIIQEIALLGLWRAKFFEHAAFYGGTALRIFYGLDRFSEDLDFTLLKPQKHFNLALYNQEVVEALQAFGFTVSVEEKKKTKETAIQSAFIKADTLLYDIGVVIKPGKKLKIKFEVDTQPPSSFATEVKLILQPTEFYVKLVAPADLLAGKLHAVLCRRWQQRVKGRDWYDLVWFIKQDIPVHLAHLKARMVQSGHLEANVPFTETTFRALLKERVNTLDIELAKRDIAPFLKESARLDIWSKAFFMDVVSRVRCAGSQEHVLVSP